MINNNDIRIKLAEIANIVLNEDYVEIQKNGLFDGTSGIALFCFLYYKEYRIQAYWDKGISLMNQGIDIASNSSVTSICSGLSGLTWTYRFLAENDLIHSSEVESLNDADDYLYKSMVYEMVQNRIDFLHNSIGIAVYFANRLKVEKYLRECVTILRRLSMKDDQGRKWIFHNKVFPEVNATNLSLSHGMSSIVILLSKISQLSVDVGNIMDVVRECVTFLMNQRFSAIDNRMSLFPNWAKDIDNSGHSRMGWCYGDLGIALAIYHAAIALDDQAIKEYSIKCFMHSAKRTDLIPDFVRDCGICHGTAGIALIFFRMYKNTGIVEFKSAYEFWFNQTLDMASHKDGLAGFKTWTAFGFERDYTLLSGITGIGLALLSLNAKKDLHWDECLLLS